MKFCLHFTVGKTYALVGVVTSESDLSGWFEKVGLGVIALVYESFRSRRSFATRIKQLRSDGFERDEPAGDGGLGREFVEEPSMIMEAAAA